MQLQNAVVVVTGAASGLGEGVARSLQLSGAQVAGLDVNEISIETKSLGSIGYICDVSDERSVSSAISRVAKDFGTIHAVVNCAGITKSQPLFGPEGRYPTELFRKIVDVNLIGTFMMMAYATEVMVNNQANESGERGVFVNVASIAAFDRSSSIGYSASKGGVVSLSLTAAHDLAQYGIRTNAIAPGFMDTRMFGGLSEVWVSQLMKNLAFPKRLAAMDEFAHAAKFLIENAYMNGATVRLDAGGRV